MIKLRCFICSLFIIIPIYIHAQDFYYPGFGEGWKKRSAGELGINEQKLAECIRFINENEYSGSKDLRIAILEAFNREPDFRIAGPVKERGGPAGMIIKNGYLVASWGDIRRVDMTFSVTKSFLSAVAGLAYDKNLIQTEKRVSELVWDGTFNGEHNSRITWNHLLYQTSDWSGQLFGVYDWADRPPDNEGMDDWRNRELHEPGSVFKYNDVRVNLLAYSLLQVFREPLPLILRKGIMDPIGASTTWRWYGYDNSWVEMDGLTIQSVSGGGHFGGGLFISTEDMARFGYLFLRGGRWDGKQVLSKEWISRMRVASPANPSYGYLWWLNQGNGKWEGVNDGVYYAAGFGGNYIIIDEKNDLLIVTRWLEPSKIGILAQMVSELIQAK